MQETEISVMAAENAACCCHVIVSIFAMALPSEESLGARSHPLFIYSSTRMLIAMQREELCRVGRNDFPPQKQSRPRSTRFECDKIITNSAALLQKVCD